MRDAVDAREVKRIYSPFLELLFYLYFLPYCFILSLDRGTNRALWTSLRQGENEADCKAFGVKICFVAYEWKLISIKLYMKPRFHNEVQSNSEKKGCRLKQPPLLVDHSLHYIFVVVAYERFVCIYVSFASLPLDWWAAREPTQFRTLFLLCSLHYRWFLLHFKPVYWSHHWQLQQAQKTGKNK